MDIIFVNIDAAAQPLDDHLAKLTQHFGPYGITGMQFDAPTENTERIVNINWKLYHEGGLEGYHIPWVHPALEQPPGYTVDVAEGVFIATSADLGNYKRLGTEGGTKPALFPLNPLAQSAAENGQRLPYTLVFTPPTVIVACWPEMLITTLLRPILVNSTGIRRRMYFLGTPREIAN